MYIVEIPSERAKPALLQLANTTAAVDCYSTKL